MVSDNATTFLSEQFKSYCDRNEIFQKLIVPGHIATNGLAKQNVQLLKNCLKTMTDDPPSVYAKVREILFRCRAIPLFNNKMPAEMYLKHNIRIQFDAILHTKC